MWISETGTCKVNTFPASPTRRHSKDFIASQNDVSTRMHCKTVLSDFINLCMAFLSLCIPQRSKQFTSNKRNCQFNYTIGTYLI